MRYLIVLFFVLSVSMQAQSGYQNITEKRISFLSTKLTLTSEQAQQFWPLFREYHQKREAITAKRKNAVTFTNDLNDAESLELVNSYIDVKVKQALLLEEYHKKYLEILPSKNVLELYKYDEDFNKHLLKQIKEAGKGKKRK